MKFLCLNVKLLEVEKTLAVKQKLSVEGMSLGSCSHWRREVGTDNSLNFHIFYNPLSLHEDFVLYRFGNTWEVNIFSLARYLY